MLWRGCEMNIRDSTGDYAMFGFILDRKLDLGIKHKPWAESTV